MDLNESHGLEESEQVELTIRILDVCNPKQIAKNLIDKLHMNAATAKMKGERKAISGFYFYNEDVLYGESSKIIKSDALRKIISKTKEGPLVDFDDRDRASELLYSLICEHINDSDIQIELGIVYDYTNGMSYVKKRMIIVSLEW
jgi:hypothetical protein